MDWALSSRFTYWIGDFDFASVDVLWLNILLWIRIMISISNPEYRATDGGRWHIISSHIGVQPAWWWDGWHLVGIFFCSAALFVAFCKILRQRSYSSHVKRIQLLRKSLLRGHKKTDVYRNFHNTRQTVGWEVTRTIHSATYPSLAKDTLSKHTHPKSNWWKPGRKMNVTKISKILSSTFNIILSLA